MVPHPERNIDNSSGVQSNKMCASPFNAEQQSERANFFRAELRSQFEFGAVVQNRH